MKKISVPVIAGSKPRTWITQAPLEFSIVYVEEDFHTDGASIPLGFRWLFPHGGLKFEPAILHDKLYRTGVDRYGTQVSRKLADTIFLGALCYNGYPTWKAKLMYSALRIGGWKTWQNYRTSAT